MRTMRRLAVIVAIVAIVAVAGLLWARFVGPVATVEVEDDQPWVYVKDRHGSPVFDSSDYER